MTPSRTSDVTQDGADANQTRQCLEKILASSLFAGSARHQQFLRFVVQEALEGRAGEIKETVLAVQVFGRRSDFDSHSDSVVRVQATNLRKRLREYYQTEGLRDPVVIEIPPGSYVPVFRPAARASRVGRLPRRIWLPAAVALAVLAGVFAMWEYRRFTSGLPASVAVLPMADFGDPELKILCQGLTEDLTTELARLPRLSVIARTTAVQFQPHGEDVREIGRRLAVSHVIEGSIRREGDRIRFNAQLIDTRSRSHIWSEAWERDAKDAPAAEAEVTRLIAAGAAERLGVSDLAAASPVHVPSAGARNLFWQARYLSGQKLNPEAWQKALGLLEQAVRQDPQYVEAWSTLARLAATHAFHGVGPFPELIIKARGAAARTLELDGRNPDALVALAVVNWLEDHDWAAAESHFRRLLELNPSSASGHGWYFIALLSRGRFDEALAELDAAARLNPMPSIVSNDRAALLYVSRRYSQAIARERQVLALDPKFWYAHITIGECEAARGRYADAIREYQLVPAEHKEFAAAPLGHALARSGRRAEAVAILRTTLSQLDNADGGNTRVQAAFIQVGLGDKPAALASLEDAAFHHETDANYIAVEPMFDPLRGEPRFQSLLKRLGLPATAKQLVARQ